MLVSLIIPVYNVSNYLPKLLLTVLSQTHTELEVILINDGSTDSSGKICDKYAEDDKRINNLAYDYVQYLLDLCVNNSADLACCAWTYDYGQTLKKCSYRYNEPGLYLGKHEAMRALLTTRLMSSSSCGKMFKRKLFDEIRFPSGINLYEDDATIYRLVNASESVVIGSESKYFYRQRNGSAVHKPFNENNLSIIKIYEDRCSFIETNYPELALYARSDILMVVNHCVIRLANEKFYHHPSINRLKTFYKQYEKDFLKGISYFPAKLFSLAAYISIPMAMRLYKLSGKHLGLN